MSSKGDIRIRSSDETAEKMIKRETATEMEAWTEKQLFGRPLNTLTPCAACKLLRRRCADHCPLTDVPESQRAFAANSLVYEANLRLRDPVKGCMGAVSALQHQIEALQIQLHSVRAEISNTKTETSPPPLRSYRHLHRRPYHRLLHHLLRRLLLILSTNQNLVQQITPPFQVICAIFSLIKFKYVVFLSYCVDVQIDH